MRYTVLPWRQRVHRYWMPLIAFTMLFAMVGTIIGLFPRNITHAATGAWTTLPHMQVARHGFAAAIVGNKLHVMGGGFQSDGMPDVDPTTSTHEVIDLGAE